jgi:polysaccharide pyruvyl transferase WcaK-like protein
MVKKYNCLYNFLKQNMQLGTKCNRQDVTNVDGDYDKYVVGSDIVWGLDITDADTAYFLDFVGNRDKKFAFSSSVGTPWSDDEKKLLRPLLQEFKYIAVREKESADWVEELTSERPDIVCDPTMLLSGEEWGAIKSDKYKNHKYVFVYFNESEGRCLEMAKNYAKQHNLEVYYVNYWGPIKGVHSVRPYSLEDFLSLIYHAQRVFTASYHGMLFSTYFEKNFVFFNRAHKSRMRTLAKRLNVEHCDGEVVDVNNLPDIDYGSVNEAVEEYRNYSMERLGQMIKL